MMLPRATLTMTRRASSPRTRPRRSCDGWSSSPPVQIATASAIASASCRRSRGNTCSTTPSSSGVRDTAIGRALTPLSLRASSRPIGPRPMTHTTASSSEVMCVRHLRALPVVGALARHQVRQPPRQREQQQQRVLGHDCRPGRRSNWSRSRRPGCPWRCRVDAGRGEMHPAQRLAVAAQRLAGRRDGRSGCWSRRSPRPARRGRRPRARRRRSSRVPGSPWRVAPTVRSVRTGYRSAFMPISSEYRGILRRFLAFFRPGH